MKLSWVSDVSDEYTTFYAEVAGVMLHIAK